MRKFSRRNNLLTARPKGATRASRFSVEYWRERVFRPTYGSGSEVLEWYAQIQYGGRREKIGLGTNNKEAASRKATQFYSMLREKGWDAALTNLSPDHDIKPKNVLTIGELIEKVRNLAGVRPRTFEIYAYALRKIAREAMGMKEESPTKYDPKSLGWRTVADQLSLHKLTPDALASWKLRVLSESGQDAISQQRARRNINSFARNARALFSKKILKKLAKLNVELPSPLPFEGFEFEEQGSMKYTAKIDAGKLLQSARDKLATTDPEAWKVILLALGAGLRRAEIDGLLWNGVNSTRGEIRIANHAYFEAKTEDSEGMIFVDPALLAELDKFRSTRETDPVIGVDIPFRQSKGVQHYRCKEIFQRATAWLRANGVVGDKPLHTLRKEFGSIICAAADIHTASRQLRHSNLSTTAAFYADHRKRATVPVGELLQPAATGSEKKE